MNDLALPLVVSIAYLSLVAFSVYVFARWLSFRGRVSALVAAQVFLALHFLFLKWESLHWLTWPFVWPAWCLISLGTFFPLGLLANDPNQTFAEGLDRLARAIWTCTLIGFVCSSVVLGVATGFASDVVRRRRRRRALARERRESGGPD